MTTFTRRAMMTTTAAAAAAAPASIPIIDTHVHFFDMARPQGVPYPPKGGLGGITKADASVFRKTAAKLGVVGAVEVEASPWIEDNLWVLLELEKDPIMVGTIGNLEPDKPEFREYLERYHRNPLFLGLRYGNIWGRSLVGMVDKPEFIAGIKELAAANLTFDTANPRVDLLRSVITLTDKVPNLRVVLDHVPGMTAFDEPDNRGPLESTLRELAKRNVYAKLSVVARREGTTVNKNLASHKHRLDLLCDAFGEDRVVYGSDWPNSTGNWISYADNLKLVQEYFATKSRAAAEKYFWRNSVAAYRWVHRSATQPKAS
ncbi:MAG: amidohydrolase family protein [Acidobacteriota bacterium]